MPLVASAVGDEHLDLRLTLADREEEVVRLLGCEVTALGPSRALLVERKSELVAEDGPSLLDRVRDDSNVVEPDEHGLTPAAAAR